MIQMFERGEVLYDVSRYLDGLGAAPERREGLEELRRRGSRDD